MLRVVIQTALTAVVIVVLYTLHKKFNLPILVITPFILVFAFGYLLYGSWTKFIPRQRLMIILVATGLLIIGIIQLLGHYVFSNPPKLHIFHIVLVMFPLIFVVSDENKKKGDK